MRIPAPDATTVELRYAALLARDTFDPARWPTAPLARETDPAGAFTGHWTLDLASLALPDGDYEYEFVVDGAADAPVADPFAEEIVRFGGYRGLFRVRAGRPWRPPFSWADELPPGEALPPNEALVIYELPMRWTSPGAEQTRQVGLGTFERAIFERLDQLVALGVNCVELLPVQDSPDTLNWGYGTRFFAAPDVDMGAPTDLRLFVKRCHQRGVRVILDVVMNHARECPLERLAPDWYFLRDRSEEPGRGEDWGARMFRYRRPAPPPAPADFHPARELHYRMAELWVESYHVDGFRIDEFSGIDHWEFVQTFRDRALAAHRGLFPDRPFIVIAEDSGRRAIAARDAESNPGGRRVVDAIWSFAYRDELRHLVRDELTTAWGQAGRRERIVAAVTGARMWEPLWGAFRDGFARLGEAVNYLTSHDVQDDIAQRLMNYLFGATLRAEGLGDGAVDDVRRLVDALAAGADLADADRVRQAHARALDRVRGAFTLLLTSVGVPMFLAGEEFADVHDVAFGDYRLKMSDPVDWQRRDQPGHRALWNAVRDLVRLRTSHPALRREETEFFYFHPGVDDDGGVRVFAYARTDGRALGSAGQVVVVANLGPHDFPSFDLPWWPWTDAARVAERGGPSAGGAIRIHPAESRATLALAPFQVRAFTT